MKFDIRFDAEEFGKGLERQVKNAANNAIERLGNGLQAACDEVFAGREGKSADQLFGELRANLDGRALPITLADDKVRYYADAMAAGRRVNVKADKI
jgi:hypothetical protein